jgi:heme-degrading monooxygenase HmoA
MIARIWHGRTPASVADEYLAFLRRTALPDYTSTPGNQGLWILRSVEDETADFLLITLWESVESIKRFAGEDYQKARYYPEDKDYLIEFEESAGHYEVLLSPSP